MDNITASQVKPLAGCVQPWDTVCITAFHRPFLVPLDANTTRSHELVEYENSFRFNVKFSIRCSHFGAVRCKTTAIQIHRGGQLSTWDH